MHIFLIYIKYINYPKYKYKYKQTTELQLNNRDEIKIDDNKIKKKNLKNDWN